MSRVATRFGLEVPDLTAYLAGQVATLPAMRQIDDTTPDPELLKVWAQGCSLRQGHSEPVSPVIDNAISQPFA
jgi:hypothetical protein